MKPEASGSAARQCALPRRAVVKACPDVFGRIAQSARNLNKTVKTCQACGHRPAVVEFIQVTGDVRRELSLCRECALSMGVRAQVEAFQRLSQLLLHDLPLSEIPEEMKAALGTKCSNCGLVFQEFVKTGLLGCPKCYEDFKDLLKPVLRRMHGVTKKPAESQNLTGKPDSVEQESATEIKEQLEMELHLALLEEDYEKAASLRDKLKKLPPSSRREDSMGPDGN